jgi:hypothetical protein
MGLSVCLLIHSSAYPANSLFGTQQHQHHQRWGVVADTSNDLLPAHPATPLHGYVLWSLNRSICPWEPERICLSLCLQSFGQPLYVSGVKFTSFGLRNAIFTVTDTNVVWHALSMSAAVHAAQRYQGPASAVMCDDRCTAVPWCAVATVLRSRAALFYCFQDPAELQGFQGPAV